MGITKTSNDSAKARNPENRANLIPDDLIPSDDAQDITDTRFTPPTPFELRSRLSLPLPQEPSTLAKPLMQALLSGLNGGRTSHSCADSVRAGAMGYFKCGYGISTGAFNPEASCAALRGVSSSSQHMCARYVRQALQAGGIPLSGWPLSAKDYDGYLQNYGFSEVASSQNSKGYIPQVGDVIVINPPDGSHPHGHICMVVSGRNGEPELKSDFAQGDRLGYHGLTMASFMNGHSNGLSIAVLRHESQMGPNAIAANVHPGVAVKKPVLSPASV